MKKNAIILAAGTSSRFVPISFEIPKSLLKIRGEVLIERQIKQLQEAGIYDITVVVGYKKELFYYLKDKYNVSIVNNEDYHIYNNTSSLMRVLDKLENTYICSSDNYFTKNVFLEDEEHAYYSAIYANEIDSLLESYKNLPVKTEMDKYNLEVAIVDRYMKSQQSLIDLFTNGPAINNESDGLMGGLKNYNESHAELDYRNRNNGTLQNYNTDFTMRYMKLQKI